ncbi:RNA recognition motif [Popillia japonica]|uniref:RNA recognition motif n=1 Tax=Popillia japonica TaxID=7064 RepID=A0AAW1KI07_POPJA
MGTESDPKLKLYIRLPVRIEEELQIKELHPDIVKVVLPRQKSRRWCVVQFPSVEILRKAKKEIKKKRINGRKIVVSPYRQGKQGKKKPKQEGKKGENKEELFFIDTKPLLSLLEKN